MFKSHLSPQVFHRLSRHLQGQGAPGAAAQRGPEKDATGPSVGEQGGEGGKFAAAGDGIPKHHGILCFLFMKSDISTVLCVFLDGFYMVILYGCLDVSM